MRKKKALSITISAVMMLVFTVALAGLYGGWVKNYFTTSTKSADEEDLPEDCDKVDLEIKEIILEVPYTTVDTFQDGSSTKSFEYEVPGNQTAYIEVPVDNVLDATMEVEGAYY